MIQPRDPDSVGLRVCLYQKFLLLQLLQEEPPPQTPVMTWPSSIRQKGLFIRQKGLRR